MSRAGMEFSANRAHFPSRRRPCVFGQTEEPKGSLRCMDANPSPRIHGRMLCRPRTDSDHPQNLLEAHSARTAFPPKRAPNTSLAAITDALLRSAQLVRFPLGLGPKFRLLPVRPMFLHARQRDLHRASRGGVVPGLAHVR